MAGEIDTSVPSVARMYDYWLGGTDNFPADREAARLSELAIPQLPWLARENRKFLRRAVRFCAGEGITQFLDIGSGLPTAENVHEVARRACPDARVVYVDNDPLVVRHASALLGTEHVVAIRGDLTDPRGILDAPQVRRLIDFSRPVALLIVAVLHFIGDEADPDGCVRTLLGALAPGSYLVISHAVDPGDDLDPGAAREMVQARRGLPGMGRTRAEIERFFRPAVLVEPGLTDIWGWRPDAETEPGNGFITLLGGVAKVVADPSSGGAGTPQAGSTV